MRIEDQCPRDLQSLLERDATRWSWERAIPRRSQLSHVAVMPMLEPIHLELRQGKDGMLPEHKNAMKAVLAGAIKDAGRETCQLCGVCVASGHIFRHYMFECDATMRFRRDYGMEGEVIEQALYEPDERLWVTRPSPGNRFSHLAASATALP